jgi:hypothetical protein
MGTLRYGGVSCFPPRFSLAAASTLEVARAQDGGGLLADDGQHGLAIHPRVVEAVERVDSAGSGGDPEPTLPVPAGPGCDAAAADYIVGHGHTHPLRQRDRPVPQLGPCDSDRAGFGAGAACALIMDVLDVLMVIALSALELALLGYVIYRGLSADGRRERPAR